MKKSPNIPAYASLIWFRVAGTGPGFGVSTCTTEKLINFNIVNTYRTMFDIYLI